jgi:flagellar hook-length control protein FliK
MNPILISDVSHTSRPTQHQQGEDYNAMASDSFAAVVGAEEAKRQADLTAVDDSALAAESTPVTADDAQGIPQSDEGPRTLVLTDAQPLGLSTSQSLADHRQGNEAAIARALNSTAIERQSKISAPTALLDVLEVAERDTKVLSKPAQPTAAQSAIEGQSTAILKAATPRVLLEASRSKFEVQLLEPPKLQPHPARVSPIETATLAASSPEAAKLTNSLPLLPTSGATASTLPNAPEPLWARRSEPFSTPPNTQVKMPATPSVAPTDTRLSKPAAVATAEDKAFFIPQVFDADVALATSGEAKSMSAIVTASPSSLGPDTARFISQQITTALTTSQGRTTEIALNPEELGRVRLTLSVGDGGVTLVVSAERPETNELLRRHIDVLAQEFRAIGYDTVSFSFDSDGSDAASTHPDEVADTDHIPTDKDVTENPASSVLSSGGLDLRL